MLIEAKALKYWMDYFYGYGSWQAKFWFVGFEETGGDLPEELAGKLNYFYDLEVHEKPSLCEIRELYTHVPFRFDGPGAGKFQSLHDYRFGTDATLHGLWKNLIAFVHGYERRQLPDLLTYQRESFALASAANEALIPLYPLPAHNHAWYYPWLELPEFPFLRSRALYQEEVYAGRVQTILENIGVYQPEVALMYDMDNINLLKKSVQDFFPDAVFKTAKAIKQKIPQHHYAHLNGTVLLITTQVPALRHNRIETGFDWYRVGELVNEYHQE